MSKFLNFDTNIKGAEDSMLKAFGDIRAFLLVIISAIQREAYSVCDTKPFSCQIPRQGISSAKIF